MEDSKSKQTVIDMTSFLKGTDMKKLQLLSKSHPILTAIATIAAFTYLRKQEFVRGYRTSDGVIGIRLSQGQYIQIGYRADD